MGRHKVRRYDGSGLHELRYMECGLVDRNGRSKDGHTYRWDEVECDRCLAKAGETLSEIVGQPLGERIEPIAAALGSDRRVVACAAIALGLGGSGVESRIRQQIESVACSGAGETGV